jgi:hypothetical protein
MCWRTERWELNGFESIFLKGNEMARCPVEGCTRPVAFGSKGLARDAAVLGAFFPVFDRAKRFWPDKFPEEFFTFVDMGRGFFGLVHARAHGDRSVLVPVQKIKEWRSAAASSCEGIAIVDPEWFRKYWTSVEARGLKLPPVILDMVIAIEEEGHLTVADEEEAEPSSATTAHARWDTGPLESSEQCEGEVIATTTGLRSVATSGTTAEIRWEDLSDYAVASDNSVLAIRAGLPWFWLFLLEPRDADHCQEWVDVLESNGVPRRSATDEGHASG